MLKIAFALILGLACAEPLWAADDPCRGVKEIAALSTLTPGIPITVVIHQLRDGSNGGHLLSVTLPDGTQLGRGVAVRAVKLPPGGTSTPCYRARGMTCAPHSNRDIGLSTKGTGFASSLEGGYPFHSVGGWLIEPEAQLIYQTISLSDTNDAAAQVRFDNVDSLAGRIGGVPATAGLALPTIAGCAHLSGPVLAIE